MNRLLLPLTALCLGLAISCAKTQSDNVGADAKDYLEKWIKKYHSEDIKATENGLYWFPAAEVAGTGDPFDPELPYVHIRYTVRSLGGTVSGTSEEAMALQLGTYKEGNYYGAHYQQAGEGYSVAGLDAMFSGDGAELPAMRIGGSRTAIVPAWMLTTSRYSSQQAYLDACSSSTHLIYKITLEGQVADAEAEGIRRMGETVADFAATHGYQLSDAKKSYWPEEDNSKYYEDSFWMFTREDGFPEDAKLSGNETININYTGRRLDGTVFDTSIRKVAVDAHIDSDSKTYEPQSVALSSTYSGITMGGSSLISGFQGALSLMQYKGQTATVFFASEHGYSTSGSGDAIPGWEPLIFEIEILADE